MADVVSRSSVESASDDFVVVDTAPKLKIGGNGDSHELEETLKEVLIDDRLDNQPLISRMPVKEKEKQATVEENGEEQATVNENGEQQATDTLTVVPSTPYMEESMMLDSDASIFTDVTYLGAAAVSAPKSDSEIYRNMTIFNELMQKAVSITLSVPSNAQGTVHILDSTANSILATFRIHRILFCARGPPDTAEKRCFAFTCSHGDVATSLQFQCHMFRCELDDLQAGKILNSFATAFRRVPKSLAQSHEVLAVNNLFKFNVSLEIKEDDGRGNFVACPKEKNFFKLRVNVDKKLVINVTQLGSQKELEIQRCFGLLLCPGRNVRNGDMHIIDMDSSSLWLSSKSSNPQSMGATPDNRAYTISGHWDPTDPNFQILNTETPKDTRVFLTVAVDLVITGIQEPVRFLVETRAKIFPPSERFWYFSKKPHCELFMLKLKEVSNSDPAKPQYEVETLESNTEIERKKALLALSSSKLTNGVNGVNGEHGDDSDKEEVVLSGSGAVSKEITDADLISSWHDVLTKWHQNLKVRPKQVLELSRRGIPEALRGEVWQLLSGCSDNTEMLELYKQLLPKDSPCEQMILRDINRTFPAHDYFREAGGLGQDALYKISKSYSIYDEEVGYCQGLSFFAAALTLHMPEEEAFCVLVKVMFDYSLRELYKPGFEDLHVKFYQLERLMQDQLPDLYDHFTDLGLESHMYASQWFLTLYSAKFPLYMVFHIIDLFLCDGIETLFRVALSLLKASRRDLLALDFEGVLKYFRVSLPRKYRSEEAAAELVRSAAAYKLSAKKLKKYEQDYMSMKEAQMQQEDPVEVYQRENKRLLESNLRLEQENDSLARELVTSKISLRSDLDSAEDNCEILSKDLRQVQQQLQDVTEEKKRLEEEVTQVKDFFRQELDRLGAENSRNQTVATEYKQICSDLSERMEQQQAEARNEIARIKAQIRACNQCSLFIDPSGHLKKINQQVTTPDYDPRLEEKFTQVRELELELAHTKLALVESECKLGELTHQLSAALDELQVSKNTWFRKMTSFRDPAKTGGAKKDASISRRESKD